VNKLQVWYGGYKQELWEEECLQACEDFFNDLNTKGRYSLVQATGNTIKDYRNAFRKAYFTRGSGGR
jgi:predicted esterase YcpF (UPF0227 family)